MYLWDSIKDTNFKENLKIDSTLRTYTELLLQQLSLPVSFGVTASAL